MLSAAARLRLLLSSVLFAVLLFVYFFISLGWIWLFILPIISMNLTFMPVWFHTMLTLGYMFITLFATLLCITYYFAGEYLGEKITALQNKEQAWMVLILVTAVMITSNLTHFLKTISR
ncbi:MAG: hypothetical protein VX730_09275 [Pseudomonadota bacterium]|nr:hypothetical protein [Pseudomonadota bacterium]